MRVNETTDSQSPGTSEMRDSQASEPQKNKEASLHMLYYFLYFYIFFFFSGGHAKNAIEKVLWGKQGSFVISSHWIHVQPAGPTKD